MIELFLNGLTVAVTVMEGSGLLQSAMTIQRVV